MVDLNTVVINTYNYLILAYITAQIVKGYLLILRKTSLTNASFASLSNDDFVKNEASVASSLEIEEAEEAKEVKAAKAAKI